MNILFIGDKFGKVHQDRFEMFSRYITEHNFSFVSVSNVKKYRHYDAVYLASYSMLKKLKIIHNKLLSSVTSWKLINEGADLGFVSKFSRLSVNSKSLLDVLAKKRKDIWYLPNGVDDSFFIPRPKSYGKNKIVVGWVGNTDRQEKNFHIVQKLKSLKLPVVIKSIETTKKMSADDLMSKERMRDFYHGIDFYLICSSFEGTPNPALEAAACGIPLLSTRVGNMPEVIQEGKNGMFLECNIDNIARVLSGLPQLDESVYKNMSNNIRETIVKDWTWEKACSRFSFFFNYE